MVKSVQGLDTYLSEAKLADPAVVVPNHSDNAPWGCLPVIFGEGYFRPGIQRTKHFPSSQPFKQRLSLQLGTCLFCNKIDLNVVNVVESVYVNVLQPVHIIYSCQTVGSVVLGGVRNLTVSMV